jgi:hypothetical protein
MLFTIYYSTNDSDSSHSYSRFHPPSTPVNKQNNVSWIAWPCQSIWCFVWNNNNKQFCIISYSAIFCCCSCFSKCWGKKSNFLLTLYKNWLSDSTIVCRFFFVFYVIRANRKEQRGGREFHIKRKETKKKKIRHDQGWIFPTVESELIINLLYSVIIKDL